jgi:HPt (histidine-containing phosphotransfer) domain-containing protein
MSRCFASTAEGRAGTIIRPWPGHSFSLVMYQQIDIPRFEKSAGGLDLLAVVARAFLRQLPQWKMEFSSSSDDYDIDALKDLLHKMKGSCHAIAAHGAATRFESAEQGIRQTPRHAWRDQSLALLDLVAQIEKELRMLSAERDEGASVTTPPA